MKRVLVATDFSTRSDRALRRGTLLARQFKAALLLVHVTDDDQPEQRVDVDRQTAGALLHDLATTARDVDGVACEVRLELGVPFVKIPEIADDADADLIVMGPHRRQFLRDAFTGTTVERTIRRSHRPIVMANALPARPYARVLLATDLSECSAVAMNAARNLAFVGRAESIVLHVYDALADRFATDASLSREQRQGLLAGEERRAGAELAAFLARLRFEPDSQVLRPVRDSAALTILDCARRQQADLIVVGTHGRAGIGKILLGSVAQEVLRDAEIDVLSAPPVKAALDSPSS